WNSKLDSLESTASKEQGNMQALKLSKGQKKRAKKKLKKAAPNSAALKGVETVVFQNPDAGSGHGSSTSTFKRKANDPASQEASVEIDLKKARFEVMKFGMNSMKSSEKYDAETALAVSLGAKPGKKEYINYKELLVVRKGELEKQREQEEMLNKTKPKPKKTKKEKTTRRKEGGGIVKIKNVKQFLNKSNNNQKRKR
ncbi:unnamed protein product, partial [Allacma fusca]